MTTLTIISVLILISLVCMAYVLRNTSNLRTKKRTTEPPVIAQSEPPTSEATQEPLITQDNHKPSSASKYERFSNDEIEEVRDQLTTHQRVHIQGGK